MRIDSLTPGELAQFGDNLITRLSGTDLSAIDPNVRATLVASFGAKPAELAALDAAAERLKSEAIAAIAVRDAVRLSLLTDCRSTRDTLKSTRAPKEQFDMCGFDFVDASRSTYVAQTPSGLAVDGYSNGINRGEFNGNNRSGAVNYEVWRREGVEGAWMLLIAMRAPSFIDEGAVPGQYYEYKVRARAARNVSSFSNSAVIYSAIKPAG